MSSSSGRGAWVAINLNTEEPFIILYSSFTSCPSNCPLSGSPDPVASTPSVTVTLLVVDPEAAPKSPLATLVTKRCK